MEDYIILFTTIFIGSFVHCLIGFGDALLIVPFLLMFYDLLTTNSITNNYALIIGLILTKYNFLMLKKHFLEVSLLFIGYTAMSVVGAITLEIINPKFLIIILTYILLSYPVLIIVLNKLYNFKLNKFFAILFGSISGFLGITTTINGPPLVLYSQLRKFDKNTFVGIVQPIFLWGAILNSYSYYKIGLYNFRLTIIAFSTIPIIIMNYYIAKYIRSRINEVLFKKIITSTIFISGVMLLISII